MLNDYEKVQDILMYFGKDWKICFNVSLATKDKLGNRRFFYKEYQYQSKYLDTAKVVSVKRYFNSYITIEQISNKDNSILISRGDMPILRNVVTEATSWLSSNDVFGTDKDNKLKILISANTQCNIGSNAAIRLEPVIYYNEYNITSSPGIRMSINDERNYIDIEAKDFYSFYELLRTFDFYGSACAVIAGLPITHDDASINRSDIEAEIDSRFNNYQKKPGFFDK